MNFLSSQKLPAAMFLQEKSIMQVLAGNILIRIPIVNIDPFTKHHKL